MVYRLSVIVCALGLMCTGVQAQGEEQHPPNERIHHLRQAAENLDAAGLGREADELRMRAEQIEAEWREHHAHHPNHPEEVHVQVMEQLRDIHNAINGLREEVSELRKQLQAMNKPPHREPEQFGQGKVFRFIPGPEGPKFEPVPDAWELNMPPQYGKKTLRADPAPQLKLTKPVPPKVFEKLDQSLEKPKPSKPGSK